MKYAIVIPDGAGDLPQDSLRGRTPFELADCPAFDRVAAEGRFGTTRNIPENLPAGSDVAILSLLGYDPATVYTGRAPLEALARDIPLARDDLVFRCNLVTVVEGTMVDNSAGGISTEEGGALLSDIAEALGDQHWEFHPGVGYRHLLVHRGHGRSELRTTPPHDILGRPTAGHLPQGRGAEEVNRLMEASRKVLADHEINRVRRDLGEQPATQIWLWGEGLRPKLESFEKLHGLFGAAITAVDLVRGIAKAIGWRTIEVEGANGYLDTNYRGKGQAAIATLDKVDLVCVHVEAPDECGHEGNASHKIQAIQEIDRHILAPLLKHMETAFDQWRLMVLPDHLTPINLRTHTRGPVPVGIIGTGMDPLHAGPFTEKQALTSGFRIPVGHELMEYFLRS
ncbi:MAG: cofactor-independent phosphoglycerate mutase [Anaerolineaceae bacterium]|nr:cofactor-independent phosphoglycerate mutase [Anaerolineaceae bacterium]